VGLNEVSGKEQEEASDAYHIALGRRPAEVVHRPLALSRDELRLLAY
jgi:hypothetical protein